MNQQDLIPVGLLHGPHGVRGQIRYQSYSGDLATLQAAREVVLRFADGRLAPYQVARITRHGTRMLLSLTVIDTIELAEPLAGASLLLRRDQFPPTEDDEYYWQDLIGMQVVTVSGETVGTLTSIMETGANDVYQVTDPTNGHEYLVPAIGSVVVSVDVPGRIMTIAPLDGMLAL